MQRPAIKKRAGDSPSPARRRRPGFLSSPLSRNSQLFGKKSACACGGGCPRCQNKSPIQTKLAVSQPGDVYEREADRMAEHVMRRAAPDGARHAKLEPLATRGDDLAPGAGRPLESGARAYMEERFGADFGAVRVYTGDSAAAAASRYNALAYTTGRNIVFGAGQYAPESASGQKLLAHELAHVVQQGGAASPSTPSIQRAGMGEVHLAEARHEAEAKLPAKFPASGVRVIGSGATDLAGILASCTGLDVSIAGDGILDVKEPATPRAGSFSASAKTELKRIAAVTDGIIVDTDPKGPAVTIGTFGHMTPGYQRLDVGNIKVLGAATGEKGGITACDAALHEMAEAAFARAFSLQKIENIGKTAYTPAHAEGLRVEEGVRKDFGLPQRSTSAAGGLVLLGDESPTTKVFLESMVFGEGKDAKTQLTVYRCHIMVGATEDACDNEAVASTVVAGVVSFSTQMEALQVFNKNAAAFGLQPIPVPAAPKKSPK